MVLAEKLDILKNALPHMKEVQWKFESDIRHDSELIDWFADGGEIRACYKGKTLAKENTFFVIFKKGALTIELGSVRENLRSRSRGWKEEYLDIFWKKNEKLIYCVSCMKTVEEIFSEHHKKINETTYAHSDGSYRENNLFSSSSDKSLKQLKKHEEMFRDALNKNSYPYWKEMKESGLSPEEFRKRYSGIVKSYEFNF